MNANRRVAIVGSGIAGLTCARRLQGSAVAVSVFDKGRFAGGRLATRESGGFRFDHGAQFFTVRTASFARVVESLAGDGWVTEWQSRPQVDGSGPLPRARLVGVPSMRQLAQRLSSDIAVAQSCEVERILKSSKAHGDARFRLLLKTGEIRGPFDAVFCTAPAPQSATLLEPVHPKMAAALRQVRYSPCTTLMVAFERSLQCSFDTRTNPNQKLRWVARNNSKCGNTELPECWVAHASPKLSAELIGQSAAEKERSLLQAFFDAVNLSQISPQFCQTHSWLYATVERALAVPCLFDGNAGLGAAGDFCLGPRVELAQQSGLALSVAFRKHLDPS